MGTFGDSWRLTKTSFRMIKEDKALLAFPAVAAGALLGILIMFAAGFFTLIFYQPIAGNALYAILAVMAIAMYFILWFVGLYFLAALIGAATLKLNGGNPKLADGLAIAKAHWKKILMWALIAGTVGLIIQAVSSRIKGIGGMIIGLAAQATWGLATYFILPVLIYEDLSAWGSLKRSASLYIHNFGRSFLSNIALAIIMGVAIFGAIILGVVGVYLLFSGLVIVGAALIIVAIALAVLLVLIATAAEGILTAALYRYATTGKIDEDLVNPAFVNATPNTGRPLPSSQSY
jgi:hypothetical protein